jgi:hypothetical protein
MSRVGVTNRTPARTSKPIEENVVNLAKEWKKVDIQMKKNMRIKKNMENMYRKVVTTTNITNYTPKQKKDWRKWLNDFEKRIEGYEKDINKMKKERTEINRKGQIASRNAKINKNSLKKIANSLNIK